VSDRERAKREEKKRDKERAGGEGGREREHRRKEIDQIRERSWSRAC